MSHSSPDVLGSHKALVNQYQNYKSRSLSLDLTRGKPSTEQLELSYGMDQSLSTPLISEEGFDCRNYGAIDGLIEAKKLISPILGMDPKLAIVHGTSSLNLMYHFLIFSTYFGISNAQPWAKENEARRWICLTPGYDRHFALTEALGFEPVTIQLGAEGPPMDAIEAIVSEDPRIKGIWCVPKFSNPTGHTYSNETVERFSELSRRAACKTFKVFWDNAYAVHEFGESYRPLPSLFELAVKNGTADSIVVFGSFSKVTQAGSGMAFMGCSPSNRAAFLRYLGLSTVGADKMSQMRHVKFFRSFEDVLKIMEKHAEVLRPKFNLIQAMLSEAFHGTDDVTWSKPTGGYFVSLNGGPGRAKRITELCKGAGLSITPAGSTFPKGLDPKDENLRIAPTYASLESLKKAMAVLILCVRLARSEVIHGGGLRRHD